MGQLFQRRSHSIDRSGKLSRRYSYPLRREERASIILEFEKLQLFKGAAGIEQECYQGSPLNEMKPEMDEQERIRDEASKVVDDDAVNTVPSTIYQQDTTKKKKETFKLLQTRAKRLLRTIKRTKEFKFVVAAANGKNDVVLHFLEDKKHNPNDPKPDKQNWTALMWACRRGRLETVKLLLDHGADVNAKSDNWFTSLIIASHEGHYEIVKVLLQNKEKPDVSVVNESLGWSALMWACFKKGSKEYTQKQLMENHFNIAKELVAAGADVNQKAKNGWTPLMQASKDGQVELVKFLCAQKGININHQSESSWSALTIACTYGQEDIAKILVDADADATMKKNGGVTALHIACFKGLIDTVKHMVAPCKTRQQHRININIVDDWGMTPLTLAMKAKCKEVVKYLVEEARADVNIQAEKYLMWSAIFFAVRNKDLNSYRLLRDNSANTELIDEIGNSLEAIGFGLSFSDPFNKKFVKELLEEKKKYLGMEGKPLPPPPSVLDKFKYSAKEIGWRNEQRPYLISAK